MIAARGPQALGRLRGKVHFGLHSNKAERMATMPAVRLRLARAVCLR
jgi:hypothetical protein